MEMRGLWRASNEERSQKTPAQTQQSSGPRKAGRGVGDWEAGVCVLVEKEGGKRTEKEVRGGTERKGEVVLSEFSKTNWNSLLIT